MQWMVEQVFAYNPEYQPCAIILDKAHGKHRGHFFILFFSHSSFRDHPVTGLMVICLLIGLFVSMSAGMHSNRLFHLSSWLWLWLFSFGLLFFFPTFWWFLFVLPEYACRIDGKSSAHPPQVTLYLFSMVLGSIPLWFTTPVPTHAFSHVAFSLFKQPLHSMIP